MDRDVVWSKVYPGTEADCGRHESQILRLAAHPGVVQLLGTVERPDGSFEVSLRRLPGPDLDHFEVGTVGGACALGAAVATTVADLHHLGVVHGRLQREHVLLDATGGPVLCGFSSSRLWQEAREPASEVTQLVELVCSLVPGGADSPGSRRLRRQLRRCRSADVVARRLASFVPRRAVGASAEGIEGQDATRYGAEVGDIGDTPAVAPRVRRLSGRALVLVGAVATVVVAVAIVGLTHGGRDSHHRSAIGCPQADGGCGPITAPGGVISTAAGRYQLGVPGDVIVLGRWDCASLSLPADLRPSSGQVWVFDRWPASAGEVPARLVATVPGADTLRVLPGRCDRLLVGRRSRPAVTVSPAGSSS